MADNDDSITKRVYIGYGPQIRRGFGGTRVLYAILRGSVADVPRRSPQSSLRPITFTGPKGG